MRGEVEIERKWKELAVFAAAEAFMNVVELAVASLGSLDLAMNPSRRTLQMPPFLHRRHEPAPPSSSGRAMHASSPVTSPFLLQRRSPLSLLLRPTAKLGKSSSLLSHSFVLSREIFGSNRSTASSHTTFTPEISLLSRGCASGVLCV